MRSRHEIFDEATRKRGPPEPIDGLDAAKRQKLAPMPVPIPKFNVPPLTPGTHTIAELFTISAEKGLESFDVSVLPEHIVVQIGITILQKLNADTLNQAVEVRTIQSICIPFANFNPQGVRKRYTSMLALQPEQLNAGTSPLSVEEDEDDYDPDFYNAEDSEQILNKLDSAPPPILEEELEVKPPDMAPVNYTLPPPPIMTLEEVEQVGQGTVGRVFGVMQTLEEPGKKTKAGLNRLAASSCDREDWITIITRLATRSVAGLEETETVKVEPDAVTPFSLSNTIRNSLYLYVLEDFRKRIDIAVAWLCEEWYNDKVQMMAGEESVLHYEKWVIKMLDGIIPYLDARDKVLTRFLSEIPGLSLEVLTKVKELCRDPAMVNLALTSLLYLVMMRPPVREIALDAVEDIWNTCTIALLFISLIHAF
jgi:symplekin